MLVGKLYSAYYAVFLGRDELVCIETLWRNSVEVVNLASPLVIHNQ